MLLEATGRFIPWGDLPFALRCESALRTASLDAVVTPQFAQRWQVEAWRFCASVALNSMRGRLQPLAWPIE